jgi:alkylated DNA repair dioxygenase AlkB
MSSLFQHQEPVNILPYDGETLYYGPIFSDAASANYYNQLLKTIEWKNDEAYIFGKHFVTKRKVAWYGDRDFHYTYSKATKHALPWTKELLELKKITETQSGATYNSCLLNLYHDGEEGMAYHSDDEKTLAREAAIASLSFGAGRRFLFRHKTQKETVGLTLENGSLLVMKGKTQICWLHRLPKSKKVKTPRINLTFRKMLQD